MKVTILTSRVVQMMNAIIYKAFCTVPGIAKNSIMLATIIIF